MSEVLRATVIRNELRPEHICKYVFEQTGCDVTSDDVYNLRRRLEKQAALTDIEANVDIYSD